MNSQQHLMLVLFFAASLFSFFHLSESKEVTEDTPVQQSALLSSERDPAETPALYPFVSVPEDKPSIRNLVENQAKQMGSFDEDSELREEALNQAAKSLTASDIQTLKTWVFDSTQDNAKRSVSLYLLTHAGLSTAGILYEFINTSIEPLKINDPHSNEFLQHSFENNLRVTALEGLDQMAAENPFLVAPLLENISGSNADPSLRFFADIALSGIDTGRPNKLSRYIDETLKEHGE